MRDSGWVGVHDVLAYGLLRAAPSRPACLVLQQEMYIQEDSRYTRKESLDLMIYGGITTSQGDSVDEGLGHWAIYIGLNPSEQLRRSDP